MAKNKIVTVKDKVTFRKWCNQMHFSTKQAAAVLDVSRSNIYKYLELKSGIELRGPIVLLCNLISELPGKERMDFIQNRLAESNETEHWPAEVPLSESVD